MRTFAIMALMVLIIMANLVVDGIIALALLPHCPIASVAVVLLGIAMSCVFPWAVTRIYYAFLGKVLTDSREPGHEE